MFAGQRNPLMIRLDTKAGHGAGKPTTKSIEEYTDIFCFLIRALDIQYRQGYTLENGISLTNTALPVESGGGSLHH